jgi:predicted fused transcriptional regulator/phosphomethylpyrimidine kinase|tara:strand:+ start:492 stop:773 length:282 start_codon:yes stop_codon:yes gene_type:complete
MDFDKPIDIFQSVSVIITPHDKGFTCGIIDPKSPDDRDVCSYIAKGLVRFVTSNPDLIYEEGMYGFKEDESEPKETDLDNVIDILTWKKGDLH